MLLIVAPLTKTIAVSTVNLHCHQRPVLVASNDDDVCLGLNCVGQILMKAGDARPVKMLPLNTRLPTPAFVVSDSFIGQI